MARYFQIKLTRKVPAGGNKRGMDTAVCLRRHELWKALGSTWEGHRMDGCPSFSARILGKPSGSRRVEVAEVTIMQHCLHDSLLY